MSKAIIKVGDEVNAQDFSKALSEAMERVEQAPKPKRKKKGKKLAKVLVHNPAFDAEVLVQSGRTSTKNPNIANPPRSGEARTSIAQRKVANGGSATSLFTGDVWQKDDRPLDIKAEVKADPGLTFNFNIWGKSVL